MVTGDIPPIFAADHCAFPSTHRASPLATSASIGQSNGRLVVLLLRKQDAANDVD